MSFIKHGFVLSIYFLLRAAKEVERTGLDDMTEQFYYDAVRETVALGGDAAANAAIVGGLVGSIVGIKCGLP